MCGDETNADGNIGSARLAFLIGNSYFKYSKNIVAVVILQ